MIYDLYYDLALMFISEFLS